jgi:beta-aspartyl-peptidase (threonine type)
MEYKGLSLAEACNMVVKDKLVKLGGEGGLIAVNAKGEHEFCFNSAGMYRGMRNSEGKELIAYYGK